MNELQDIEALCGTANIGGLSVVEYVEVERVDSFEQRLGSDATQKQVVVLKTGDWLRMPILFSEKMLSESQSSTDQGEVFEQRVEGDLPMHTPAIADQLDQMARHRFLVRLTDRSGQKWIGGTMEQPFRCSSSLSTGDSAAALKKHRISFTTTAIRKAPGYLTVAG
jgi:hypothetical protein